MEVDDTILIKIIVINKTKTYRALTLPSRSYYNPHGRGEKVKASLAKTKSFYHDHTEVAEPGFEPRQPPLNTVNEIK